MYIVNQLIYAITGRYYYTGKFYTLDQNIQWSRTKTTILQEIYNGKGTTKSCYHKIKEANCKPASQIISAKKKKKTQGSQSQKKV